MIFKRAPVIVAVFLIAWLGWACTKAPTPDSALEFAGQFQVDPVFRAYYDYHGGDQRLGRAISPPRKEGSATVQFLETGKMVFDPNAPANSKFRMAPLGLEMGVSEPETPPPSNPELHYLNGHTIAPEFYPMYELLGADMVGKPITEEKLNLIRKRHEQYFENLGFYRIEGTSEVHLLAYGTWVCRDKCSEGVPLAQSTIDIMSYIDPVFQGFVTQQGADMTGFALTEAYASPDGKWEQILENVVLVADSRIDPQSVSLRPLSEKVHIMVEEPRSPVGDPQMYFYPVEENKGYEIPLYFWDYIQKHGGVQVSGPPVTHYTLLLGQVYHQCFVNLCLTYDQSAIEQARVRPEPLGYAYRVLYYNAPQQTSPSTTGVPTISVPRNEPGLEPYLAPGLNPTGILPKAPGSETPVEATPLSFPTAVPSGAAPGSAPLTTEIGAGQPPAVSGSQHEIDMQVWERYVVVGQQQGQEISIWVVENDRSMVGVQAEVTAKMPDGSEQTFPMPLTNVSGQASLLLPAIEAPNGTIVPFKVCILAVADTRFCIADFFVIWNTP
jgi:hypothetical protein